jgi:hypothetical protein
MNVADKSLLKKHLENLENHFRAVKALSDDAFIPRRILLGESAEVDKHATQLLTVKRLDDQLCILRARVPDSVAGIQDPYAELCRDLVTGLYSLIQRFDSLNDLTYGELQAMFSAFELQMSLDDDDKKDGELFSEPATVKGVGK